ncbi:MAG: methyltransferase domain-containing protein [Actinobacteria bacterium]|nr:MAG: methyltransferase domain-containing protein [Actinomycetota bacterium]
MSPGQKPFVRVGRRRHPYRSGVRGPLFRTSRPAGPVRNADPAELPAEDVRWYDEAYDRDDADGHALRARMHAVLDLVGPGPGDVLDAGMGPGRLAAELAVRGWTVSGLDSADAMVAAARLRLPDAAERLVVGRIEALPFPNTSFDCVTATGVLEYSDVPRALDEVARVLRPGGRAVVSYPNPYAHYTMWKSRVYYPLVGVIKRLLRWRGRPLPCGTGTIPLRRLERLLSSAGLELVGMRPASALVLPPPLDLFFPRLAARIARRLERGRRMYLATQLVFVARKPGVEGQIPSAVEAMPTRRRAK